MRDCRPGTTVPAPHLRLVVRRDELLPANAVMTFVGRVATVVGIVGGGMIIGSTVWSRLGWTNYAQR